MINVWLKQENNACRIYTECPHCGEVDWFYNVVGKCSSCSKIWPPINKMTEETSNRVAYYKEGNVILSEDKFENIKNYLGRI